MNADSCNDCKMKAGSDGTTEWMAAHIVSINGSDIYRGFRGHVCLARRVSRLVIELVGLSTLVIVDLDAPLP